MENRRPQQGGSSWRSGPSSRNRNHGRKRRTGGSSYSGGNGGHRMNGQGPYNHHQEEDANVGNKSNHATNGPSSMPYHPTSNRFNMERGNGNGAFNPAHSRNEPSKTYHQRPRMFVNSSRSGNGNHVAANETGSSSVPINKSSSKPPVPSPSPVKVRNELPEKYMSLENNVSMSEIVVSLGDISSSKSQNQSKKDGADYHAKDCLWSSSTIGSFVKESPTLKILKSDTCLDDEVKPWCCFGRKTWNCRNFAHGLSFTNFSSKRLFEDEIEINYLDFISDWNNIKAILASPVSKDSLSFVLQRPGKKGITVDKLDLFQLDAFKDFLKLPVEVKSFINTVVGDDKEKIKREGKSNQEVLDKEAFHKILHCSMESPVEMVNTPKQNPFTHHYLFQSEKGQAKRIRFMAGSNIPVFNNTIPNRKGEAEKETVTVQATSVPATQKIPCSDVFKFWLDNRLTDSAKTLLIYHKSSLVTETKWIKTDDLSKLQPSLNVLDSLKRGEQIFRRIQENMKMGHVYWLYRAPGSEDITLYDLSCIGEVLENEVPKSILGDWDIVSPYCNYAATNALLKYAECYGEVLTEKLASEAVFEPCKLNLDVSGNTIVPEKEKTADINNEKRESLQLNFSKQVDILKKHLNNQKNLNWMIMDVDQIRSDDTKLLVKCFQGMYVTALSLTPGQASRIHKNAVECFYPVCSKLIRTLGNDHLKFWRNSTSWILNYTWIVMTILTQIANSHKYAESETLDEERSEWKYLGYRIKALHGDILFSVITRLLDGTRGRRVDEKIPKENYHERLLKLYEDALENIPDSESFRVNPRYVAETDTPVIFKKDLLKDIHRKIASALLSQVSFAISFPAFYKNVIQELKPPIEIEKVNKANRRPADNPSSYKLSRIQKLDFNTKASQYYSGILDKLGECICHVERSELKALGDYNFKDPVAKCIFQRARLLNIQLNAITFAHSTSSIEDHFAMIANLGELLDSRFFSILPNNLQNESNKPNGNDKFRTALQLFSDYNGLSYNVLVKKDFKYTDTLLQCLVSAEEQSDLCLNAACQRALQSLKRMQVFQEVQQLQRTKHNGVPLPYCSAGLETASYIQIHNVL